MRQRSGRHAVRGKLTVSMENVVLDEAYAAMNIQARPGPYVLLKVADNGTGIAEEIRDKIFEPFFTTKEIGKGTGLGLSTTSAIVRSHGGFINVYSELGKGTVFNVYFPANPTAAAAANPAAGSAAAQAAAAQTPLPCGHGELILLVDDEESVRSVGQATLERFGYRVLLACNGAEALAHYAAHQPNIAAVLTDMAMPIMDGPALIVALQLLNPTVRIVGSSGLTSGSGVAKAVDAGVKHFVPKPYTAEALLKTLRAILEAPC